MLGLGCGRVKVFLNIATNSTPSFDGGTYQEVGVTGSKTQIDVGGGAAPVVVDWDNDGRRDLLCGNSAGTLLLFLNQGTNGAPDYQSMVTLQDNGSPLYVPSGRSSPVIADLDGDGKKDLMSGCSGGAVFFFQNLGTDVAPVFSGWVEVESAGVPIGMTAGRCRPFVCDWTGDGRLDLLLSGGSMGVGIYQGLERIRLYCSGDGTGSACPCGNPGGPGEGCANSSGVGASLSATGTTSLVAADLTITATGAIAGQTGLFFQANNEVNSGQGIPFGDGLRCAGGGLIRLEIVVPDNAGDASTSVDLGVKGRVAAGDLKRYQFWYRDPVGGPCGSDFNLSNALEASWLP